MSEGGIYDSGWNLCMWVEFMYVGGIYDSRWNLRVSGTYE
jgi:hypothetical protein